MIFDLATASRQGDLEQVRSLLLAGCNVNAQASNGWTALMEAVRAGHVDVTRELSKKSDLSLRNDRGWTAIDVAQSNGHLRLVDLLKDRLMESAIRWGDLDQVRAQMQSRPHIDVSQFLGMAVAYDNLAVVQFLIDSGADVNSSARPDQGHSEYSALMKASYRGNLEIVQVLIGSGAKVDAVSEGGRTALMRAAVQGHRRVVQSLLDAGANVNIRSLYGLTALMCSAESGDLDVVRMLMASGANVSARTSDGFSALDIAQLYGHAAVAEVLRAHAAQDGLLALEAPIGDAP